MKIDSPAHRLLTVVLFAVVIGGIFVVNEAVTGGPWGWERIVRAALGAAAIVAVLTLVDRVRAKRRAVAGVSGGGIE